VHTTEGSTSLAPQLNYIIDIIFELKVKLAKIKDEGKEIKKHLTIIHLSLINEIRHNENFNSSLVLPFKMNNLSKTQKKSHLFH